MPKHYLINTFIFITLILGIFLAFNLKHTETAAASEDKWSNDVIIFIDDLEITFPDKEPFIDDNNRTLVPVRFFTEEFGATVNWNGRKEKLEIIQKEKDKKIILWIDENKYKINEKVKNMDTTLMIKGGEEGRTFVPLRFISEEFNVEVSWQGDNNSIYMKTDIKPENSNFNDELYNEELLFTKNIQLNNTKEQVIEKLGKPNRKDESKYGFKWYIYNMDYSNYFQVGIKNGEVKALFSNSENWELPGNLEKNTSRAKIQRTYGKPLEEITKGNNIISLDSPGKDIYQIENKYIFFYYDTYLDNKLDGIFVINKNIEESFKNFYSQSSPSLKYSFEKQIFDLTNAFRTKHGLEKLKWSEDASKVAVNHSSNMAENEFFSHIDQDGNSPFERMKEAGISFSRASENINMGQPNAISSYYSWLNSLDHRQNMLSEQDYLGVGLAFKNNTPYYTQKFYTK